MDLVKWVLCIILLFFDVLGFCFFSRYNFYLRVVLFLFFIFVSICIVLTTNAGRLFLVFARESRAEISRVVWPTGREALYTTFIVLLVTLITSMLLWGLDNLLVRFISLGLRL